MFLILNPRRRQGNENKQINKTTTRRKQYNGDTHRLTTHTELLGFTEDNEGGQTKKRSRINL